MSTETIERPAPAPVPQTAHGDGTPRFAHVVKKDGLTEAVVMGDPVTALCGFTWVPSRDPKKYPICPVCKEIAEHHWDDGAPEE